jgi:hypothetical protein
MKVLSILFLLFLSGITCVAQDSLRELRFSGYVEAYYVFDFNEPANHLRPSFFYNYNRHNEVNLNLGYLRGSYTDSRTRANLALMGGTYAQYNLASEPSMLRYLFEANAGFKLSRKKNVWLDAGIFPSHIGFESAIGQQCWNLTRSIVADNSPYYESGARLSYQSSTEKIYVALLYLNGWQRMQKADGNHTPAVGTQVTYRPAKKVLLNWSTYAGNDLPDSAALWRYYHNLYGQFDLSKSLSVTLGFDYGMQQHVKRGSFSDTWYSPLIIARVKLSEKFRVSARAEYFDDEHEVMIKAPGPKGFRTAGYSMNLDYLPLQNCMVRVEVRTLRSPDNVFLRNSFFVASSSFVSSSVCLSF